MQDHAEREEIERIIQITGDFWKTSTAEIGYSRKAGYFLFYASEHTIDSLKVCTTAREFARRMFYEMISDYSSSHVPPRSALTAAQKAEAADLYHEYIKALPAYEQLFMDELKRF